MDYRELVSRHIKKYPAASVFENEPMSGHTSLKIGGRAAAFFEPSSVGELADLLAELEKSGLRYIILGRGSNVLFADGELSLAVVSSCGLNEITAEGDIISAGAGAPLSKIAAAALANSLTGFETLAGIPGTLGGAVFMNAGAYGGEIKDVCESVTVYENGEIREYGAKDCAFSYRHSVFEDKNAVIISARLKLSAGDAGEIKEKMRELGERRRDKQPLEYPSAGSTFKRPQGDFAARLIEAAGLKGRTNGGAQVSEKHAGFLINRGGASFEDFAGLMETVRKEVYDYSGIMLEPEVRIVK